MGIFDKKIRIPNYPTIFNTDDIICASCGGHQLQSCDCTWEQINKAENTRAERMKNAKIVTVTWEELKQKIENKKRWK